MDWTQIIGPTLFALGGIITWIIRSKIEEARAIQQKLNEERRKTYGEILGPYIRILADLKGKGPTQAISDIKSYDYIKTTVDRNNNVIHITYCGTVVCYFTSNH